MNTVSASSVESSPATIATRTLERRVVPRIAASLDVELYSMGTGVCLRGRTRDIGCGGVCIETLTRFDLKALRRIAINLPDGVLVSRAIGRWQRPVLTSQAHLSGVQFEGLDNLERSRLWSFVHERGMEIAAFLAESSDLAMMELDEGLDLAFFTRISEFAAGTWIYRQGTVTRESTSTFVVYRGSISLRARTRRGREIFLDRLEAGSVFGGPSFVADLVPIESAVAESDVTLLEIDRYTLEYIQEVKPRAARRIARALVRRRLFQIENLIERLGDVGPDATGASGGAAVPLG